MMLRLRSLQVARENSVPRGFFGATSSWQGSFLHRHHFSFGAKTRQGQICPSDALEVAATFCADVLAKMDALEVDVVYNADETPIFFEHIPSLDHPEEG
ncbi:hypothetical protein ON010_g12365 [Phytophthora cinnamomi]|nr:hypothetical protein ON010_g12365 [Phytophthora cinnamomi]